jgi:hypothetical protein
MKRPFAATILLLAAATPAVSKPKEKIYPVNCDRVWLAVKHATRSNRGVQGDTPVEHLVP